MLELFHFQHPEWLWALPALALILWWLRRRGGQDSHWREVIDKRLQPLLLTHDDGGQRPAWLALLGVGWLIATIALADPVWQRKPQPVFQTDTARVIVLDLSRSMAVADLKPSRLARARYKVEDILNAGQEGLIGLVVFAGDAFTVTPLTRDVDTIRALLPVLKPDMMPVQGSRADLGLLKAGELLRQSGNRHGQIILIADGGPVKETTAAARKLADQGYQISVIGVGTRLGGPIPGLRDAQDKPVIVPLQEKLLKSVASLGGGRYLPVTSGVGELRQLLAAGQVENPNASRLDARQQQWVSNGPYLALLLAPLAALAFRRGWLATLLLPVVLASQPAPLLASPLDGLWLRQDQRADRALRQGDYKQAEKLASDPLRKGSAAYREGRYQQALQAFSQASGADADYNRGNALARLGKYQEAIEAYDAALKKRPNMQDAIRNREAVRKLLRQQQQKQRQQQNQKNKSGKSQSRQQQSASQKQGKQGQQQKNQQQGKSGQQSAQKNSSKSSNEKQSGQQQSANNARQKPSGQKQKSENKSQASREQQSTEQSSESGQRQNASQQKEKSDENQFAKAAEALKNKEKKKQAQPPEQQAASRQQTGGRKKRPTSRKEESQASNGKSVNQTLQNRPQKAAAESTANKLSREERMAAEQWLRRIPDDPGGLLRRKFQYQYQQRERRSDSNVYPPW